MKIIMKCCFSCIYDLIDYLFVVQRHINNIQAPFFMYLLREQVYNENEYTSKQSFKSRCIHWGWAYWWKFRLPQDKDDRYDIYRLIHGHFHIGLVIIPRPPYWPETQSRANMGRGMITRPIWKCPCIKLFITYFRHLGKRHPYFRANMGLELEMIL